MAKAKNKVIAGNYAGWSITNSLGILTISGGFFSDPIHIDSNTVEAYELVTDEHRKSAASGAARGLIGGALLGPVGALAGGLSANSKGIYQVAIQFKDGTKSLLEVDDKLYKAIIANCFAYTNGVSDLTNNTTNYTEVTSISTDNTDNNFDKTSDTDNNTNNQSNLGDENNTDGESDIADCQSCRTIVSIEDDACGDNILDNPECGEQPLYIVSDYNKQIAMDVVASVDRYFDNRDINVFQELNDCQTRISDEDKNDDIENEDVKYLKAVIGLIPLYFNRETDEKLLTIQMHRNHIARMYIVNEKFDPQTTVKEILNAIQDYLQGSTSPEITDAKLGIYNGTLNAYIQQKFDPNNLVNYKQIYDDSVKVERSFNPYAEQLNKQQIKDIAREIEKLMSVSEEDSHTKSDDSIGLSATDEIREYKKLLDDGILTEEEFAAKKKQLLGI